MIHIHIRHMVREGFAFDKIENANQIAFLILDGISMHEVFMVGHQIQDTGLFSGTAVTLERDASDMSRLCL